MVVMGSGSQLESAPALPTLLPRPGAARGDFGELNAKVWSADARTACGAAALPHARIPEVDLAPFLDEGATSEARSPSLAAALDACRQEGFMTVYGHGVPAELASDVCRLCRVFFRLPIQDKLALVQEGQKGYVGLGSENVDKALGREGAPDLREAFMMLPPDWAHDPNLWPEEAAAPGFRTKLEEYYGHMERIERGLARLFSAALAAETGRSLPLDWLSTQCVGRHRGLLKASYFPPCKAAPNQKRLAAHADLSHFTILFAESEGLEVIQDGQWRRVPVFQDRFIVNVGNQLERLSNGRFKSGIHRVNFEDGGANGRISLPYFIAQVLDPDEDMIAEPIVAEGNSPRFEAISVKEYIVRTLAKLRVA